MGRRPSADGARVPMLLCVRIRAARPRPLPLACGPVCYHGRMETDELAEYLESLRRDECYRVDAVLKKSVHEITQRVYFVGANGSEQGPFVRKYIKRDSGLGSAYRRIFEAQRDGRRFGSIPRVLECYDADECCVVVMEHVRGETLAAVVERCGASLPLAAGVVPQVCDALCELHEGFDPPIIHRDIKPNNVILTRSGPVIIDFGIARAYRGDADRDTVRFGTRAYAPPEQFGYRQTDVRSDEYALGMLLYFCLAGRDPDAGARDQGFADRGIPASVRKVLMRATAFDPDDRYANVREFKAAFLAAVRKAPAAEVRGDALPGPSLDRPASRVSAASRIMPVPEKDTSSRGEGSRLDGRRLCVRNPVPLWLGALWDALLVAFLVFAGVVGVDQVVLHPSDAAASYPTWYNAFMFAGFMIMLASWSFALFDKRLAVRRFPVLQRVQGVKGALIGIAVSLSAFIALVIVGAMGPLS